MLKELYTHITTGTKYEERDIVSVRVDLKYIYLKISAIKGPHGHRETAFKGWSKKLNQHHCVLTHECIETVVIPPHTPSEQKRLLHQVQSK